jgi:hypothetical protein
LSIEQIPSQKKYPFRKHYETGIKKLLEAALHFPVTGIADSVQMMEQI